jgi:hypothetical protein
MAFRISAFLGETQPLRITLMSRIFRIRIRDELLRAHLERENEEFVSAGELREFLSHAGFTPYGDQWLVREADLGVLDPEEVVSIEPVPTGMNGD